MKKKASETPIPLWGVVGVVGLGVAVACGSIYFMQNATTGEILPDHESVGEPLPEYSDAGEPLPNFEEVLPDGNTATEGASNPPTAFDGGDTTNS